MKTVLKLWPKPSSNYSIIFLFIRLYRIRYVSQVDVMTGIRWSCPPTQFVCVSIPEIMFKELVYFLSFQQYIGGENFFRNSRSKKYFVRFKKKKNIYFNMDAVLLAFSRHETTPGIHHKCGTYIFILKFYFTLKIKFKNENL